MEDRVDALIAMFMVPTWGPPGSYNIGLGDGLLPAPDGRHVAPMNLAIWVVTY